MRSPLLSLALLLLAGHALLLAGFAVDDAFISFRYAENLSRGRGPVYNPGERVEGFSNPLYVFALAGPARLLPLEWLPGVARLLGLLAALGSLVLLRDFSRAGGCLTNPDHRPKVASTALEAAARGLALLLTGMSLSFALWAIGGLETSIYGFLILASAVMILDGCATRRRRIFAGALLAGVTLSRPEGALYAGVLFLFRLVDPASRRDVRGHLDIALAAAVPVAAYLIFRVAYYDEWLPNTWFAKKKTLSRALAGGRWYLVSFIHHNGGKWLYLPAALALFSRPHRRAVTMSILILAATLFYILMVGGDWMDQHRFLAPVVPFIYFLTALGWVTGLEAVRRRMAPRAPLPSRVILPAGIAAALLLLLLPTVALTRKQRESPYVNATPYYETVGRWIGAVADPSWTVATHDIGAMGWYGRTRILDCLGLVSRDLARGRVTADSLIARERPELVVLHYDNRPGAAARWRPFESAGFDSLYLELGGVAGVPASIRVRADVAYTVSQRVMKLAPDLRERLIALRGYLRERQPDGHMRDPSQAG